MADLNKMNDDLAETGKLINGVVGIVSTVVSVAGPLIKVAVDRRNDNEPMVIMPELYSKNYTIKIDDAVELLIGVGLKPMTSPAKLVDAKPEFRTCIDGQVLDSKPRARRRVRSGTIIYLRYATQEFIDECQKLFESEQEKKENARNERKEKRDERREQVRSITEKIPTPRKKSNNN